MRRQRFRLGALLVVLLVLSACSPFGAGAPSSAPSANGSPVVSPAASPGMGIAGVSTSPAPAPAGDQIVEGGTAEPRTLNPLFVADPLSDELSRLVFNGLTEVDPGTGQPQPDLAESWDVSDDGLTYTFHLRQGVTWHDGQPFSARDVAFTFDLLRNDRVRSPRYSRVVERVRRVTAPDATTVDVELVQPDASFLTTIATWGIVPEHLLSDVLPEELVADPFGLSSAVGTGPFVLQQWVRGQQLIFARNEHYHAGAPAVARYVYLVVATPQDLLSGLQKGTIDWATLAPSQAEAARGIEGVAVDTLPSFDFTYVALQLDPAKSRLFLDERVRRALLLAIDRQRLVADVWKNQALVANGTLPPASWAAATSQTTFAQNLDEARRLLDEAGWTVGPDGVRMKDGQALSFRLTTNGDNPERRAAAELLIQQWRALGIDAQPDYEKWSSVRERVVSTRDFDALLLGYRWDVDPDQSALWSSDSFFDALNIGHYSNPEVDELLARGLSTTKPDERRPIYAEMQDVVLRDLPVLPLVFPDLIVARGSRLHDLQVTAILVRNRSNIERWRPSTGE